MAKEKQQCQKADQIGAGGNEAGIKKAASLAAFVSYSEQLL
ncbi:hypothetical protein ACQKP8_20675 [Photobacterium alginatilyticum]